MESWTGSAAECSRKSGSNSTLAPIGVPPLGGRSARPTPNRLKAELQTALPNSHGAVSSFAPLDYLLYSAFPPLRNSVNHCRVTPPDETNLLSRCRRGEAAAWDELFDRHYDAAARFVFQLGSDFTREDAEEICQETFLAVIKNLDSFAGESQFQTWLFRIAANKSRDFRERHHAAKRGGGQTPIPIHADEGDDAPPVDPPASAPGPDAQLLGAERLALVRRAVDRLDEPCREIIELRYFGDLSYEEISGTLGLNPKTVSSRLSKCLDRLEKIARDIFSGENTGAIPSNI